MSRKNRPSQSGAGGWLDFLFGVLTDGEVVVGCIRFVGHLLVLAVRAVFHLLTCHF